MIDHVAINVKNIKHSAQWYVKNLGFTVTYISETWAMLEKNKSKLALTLPGNHPPHFAVTLESTKDFPNQNFKYHRDGSAYLYFEDPDGNVVEYICYNISEDCNY